MVRFVLVCLLLGLTANVGAQEIKIEKSTEKIVYQGKSYYLHTVKAKETLFSICKAYGVSVDEVKVLNDKKENTLSIGEVLRIPVVEPFKSIDDKFYYHRMKPKETLYSLSRKFNIKMKRILKDNPEYDVSRPIAEGSVVKLALKQIDRNVLEAELHWEKRQAKEIQQVRSEELEKYEEGYPNTFPPARDSLEGMEQQAVGDTLFIVPDIAHEQRHVKVALMLPLYVKENKLPLSEEEIPVDTLGVNVRNERWRLSSRTEPFLQFYQGVLMAVDSLKRLGYTIELHVYDTERDPNTVQSLVGELNLLSPDLIIGPVYPNTYKAVAEQLGNRTIPMIFPLSSRGGDSLCFPNFVQLNTSTASLVEEMADWIVANGAQAHLINIIPDGGARTGDESRLTNLVQNRLQENGMSDMTNCQWRPQMHLDSLRKIMRPGVENIILFPTINEAAASRTLPVLSALADQFRITVIGFPDWLKFTSIDEEVLFKLNVKMMTNSYVDYQGDVAKRFSAKHRNYFYSEPSNVANRAFDMVMCFIPLVDAERGNTLNALREKDISGAFTRFRFHPASGLDGLENRGLYLLNYNRNFEIIVKPIIK